MGNKLVNTTSVKLGIYETSTDSQLAGMLGDKKEFEDGRVFRLCKNGGTALLAGILVQSITSLDGDDSLEIATTQTAGDREIVVIGTSNSVHAAHSLKDGYLVLSDTTDYIGTFYKIKDNEAIANGEHRTITLYDPLTTAITKSTNECTICVNPYSGVIRDTDDAPLAGVPYIAVDEDEYFWALCEGYGPATGSGSTIAKGAYLNSSAGDVVTATSNSENIIGVAVTATDGNDDALIVKYFAMG